MKNMGEKALRAVLHGKLHWRELSAHGIDVQYWDGIWTFGAPTRTPLVATNEDLMEGIRTLAQDPVAIQQWARFILAASNLIEVSELEDEVLDCLWDLSEGNLQSAARVTGRKYT